MAFIKRCCFISYHHADQEAVDQFIRTFDHSWDGFTARGLGQEMDQDIIDSTDTDYVMRRIREKYLKGSSVTLVMLGAHTWSRRYIDWEIQASLRRGVGITPNGLLGIKLPTFSGVFPERMSKNLLSAADKAAGRDCYARHMEYPTSVDSLVGAIEQAYGHRTSHANLIVNPRERFSYNKQVTSAA
jgi:hypothetical protein